MIYYLKCTYCGSENIERAIVNARLPLNGSEIREPYRAPYQHVYNPTDAFICRDCGHIDFFH